MTGNETLHTTSRFFEELQTLSAVRVKQRKELAELFGFETRNKYVIERPDGSILGYAVEQGEGLSHAVLRQFLGHWRPYTVQLYDAQRTPVLTANHPFNFYFQRLQVISAVGEELGTLKQRFSILSKRFDVVDSREKVLMTVNSPLLKIWTFPFEKGEQQVASIKKKWSGLMKEAFTDADTFELEFTPRLDLTERSMILCAGIFVDLQYFEQKAGR